MRKTNQSKFGLVNYKDSKGVLRPCYSLTKTECLYVATNGLNFALVNDKDSIGKRTLRPQDTIASSEKTRISPRLKGPHATGIWVFPEICRIKGWLSLYDAIIVGKYFGMAGKMSVSLQRRKTKIVFQ